MTAENQIEIPFEEEIQIGPIYLSDLVDKTLATETILNLGYYFYRAKKSDIEVEVLFPRAVHLINRDSYNIGLDALNELKIKLKSTKGDISKLSGTCISLTYKLIAYEKGHKKGRSKGFMSLSILMEKDLFKIKELIKKSINFFEAHPDGQLNVNTGKRKNYSSKILKANYVWQNTVWEIGVFNGSINKYDINLAKNKKDIYAKNHCSILSYPSLVIVDLCTDEQITFKRTFFQLPIFGLLIILFKALELISKGNRRKRYR